MKHDDGGPAYPTYEEAEFDSGAHCLVERTRGLSWLDLAAMHAMQGILANPAALTAQPPILHAERAEAAYKAAAALLAEKRRREAEKQE